MPYFIWDPTSDSVRRIPSSHIVQDAVDPIVHLTDREIPEVITSASLHDAAVEFVRPCSIIVITDDSKSNFHWCFKAFLENPNSEGSGFFGSEFLWVLPFWKTKVLIQEWKRWPVPVGLYGLITRFPASDQPICISDFSRMVKIGTWPIAEMVLRTRPNPTVVSLDSIRASRFASRASSSSRKGWQSLPPDVVFLIFEYAARCCESVFDWKRLRLVCRATKIIVDKVASHFVQTAKALTKKAETPVEANPSDLRKIGHVQILGTSKEPYFDLQAVIAMRNHMLDKGMSAQNMSQRANQWEQHHNLFFIRPPPNFVVSQKRMRHEEDEKSVSDSVLADARQVKNSLKMLRRNL